MRSAIVDSSGQVVNVIVADDVAPVPAGFDLVAVPDGLPVDENWIYANGVFTDPRPVPVETNDKV